MERFFSHNKDTDRLILEKLNDKDLLLACSVGKYALELCNEDFFRNRLIQNYPGSVKYKKIESWKKYYISTVYYVSKMKEKYNFNYTSGNPKEYWNILDFMGPRYKKMLLIGENASKDLYDLNPLSLTDISNVIQGAAKNNNRDFIDYIFVSNEEKLRREFFREAVMDRGLLGAVEGNNKVLADFFVKNGADDLNSPLFEAAYSGNIDMIDWLINNGADSLNLALRQAAAENQKEAVKFLVSKGASDFETAMTNAAFGGHIDMVQYINSLREKN